MSNPANERRRLQQRDATRRQNRVRRWNLRLTEAEDRELRFIADQLEMSPGRAVAFAVHSAYGALLAGAEDE